MDKAYRQVKFLETILDNMQEPIYVLDKHGKFIYVNRALIDLSGSTKEVLLTYTMYRMAEEGIIERAVSEDVLKYKHAFSFFQDVVNFRGQRHRQLNMTSPIFDSNGNVEFIVAVLLPLNLLTQQIHSANSGSRHNTLDPSRMRVDNREVVAESPAMRQVLELARALSEVDTAVLVTGETGCGKDVVAHLIHSLGHRSKGRFVSINCASLPETLLEAELFGYAKGAFTGASSAGKRGLFEEADGGTLFLDEINSMPLALQGKLLQAIETKRFTKVGSVKSTTVDFRVLAASNQDLAACVQNGSFRQDLYYRLNVMPVYIPPLRERQEDIEPLANYFLRHYGDKYGRPRYLSAKAMLQLKSHSWPGNVRELKNLIERMIITSSGEVIEISEIPGSSLNPSLPEESHPAQASYFLPPSLLLDDVPEDFSLNFYMEQCERALLQQVLKRCGSTYKAAQYLKTSQSGIARRKAKYNL